MSDKFYTISPKLSVVISFLNEEEVLPELIRRLRNVMRKECDEGQLSGYELIFVNDASTDSSEEVLISEAKGHDDIKIITMSRTFGVSPCVLAGFKYSSGDLVVYLDADLQDPPELIPQMIKAWRDGDNVEVVNTVRLSRDGETRSKLWITKLGYKILRKLSDIDLTEDSGDFKLLTRKAVNQLIRLREKKPFTRGLVKWIGFKQADVFYHRDTRFAGKTKFNVISPKVIKNFLGSALISFSEVPLHFVLLIGFIVSACSFIFLIYIVIQKFLISTTPGWSAIMATITFLGGLQLITIGILGLYIGSIYLETKSRPNYIVERKYGFDKSPGGKKMSDKEVKVK